MKMCQNLNDTLNFTNKAYGKFQMIYIVRRHIVGGNNLPPSMQAQSVEDEKCTFLKAKSLCAYTCAICIPYNSIADV